MLHFTNFIYIAQRYHLFHAALKIRKSNQLHNISKAFERKATYVGLLGSINKSLKIIDDCILAEVTQKLQLSKGIINCVF